MRWNAQSRRPLSRYYSPLLNGSHFLEVAPRRFTGSVVFRGYLLIWSQPANSKRNPKQNEWLTKKFAQFLDHQANKTTSQFFPSLYEEYFAKWPPAPTKEAITEASGNVDVATATVRQTEEYVRDLELSMLISS